MTKSLLRSISYYSKVVFDFG